MSRVLEPDFVFRYARPPSNSLVTRAVSLHENVRQVLGEADYLTFLQGSYKNDTALAEMNDVDVVVVSRQIKHTSWFRDYDWSKIFKEIEKRLDADQRYKGKWKRNDKCITLSTNVNIDIVPAIFVEAPEKDPIRIFSFSAKQEKSNWPRMHYQNAVEKNGRTNGSFKPNVRLFKRWSKCHFRATKVAPSYFIECLLYGLPDKLFTGDLAVDFISLGREICKRHDGGMFDTIPRIVGDGDLLNSTEWSNDKFRQFRGQLESSLHHAERAIKEPDLTDAKAAWRYAFAGYDS